MSLTVKAKRVSVNPNGHLSRPSDGYAQDEDIIFADWIKICEMPNIALEDPSCSYPLNAPLPTVCLLHSALLKKK